MMSHSEFQLVGGHPALDFVNSLDWRFRDSGPEEMLGTHADLVRFAVQAGLVPEKAAHRLRRADDDPAGARALRTARQLRELLADFFYSELDGHPPSSSCIRALEDQIARARRQQQLTWASRRLRWEWAGTRDEPALPVWILVMCAAELITSAALGKVRACDNPECRWLFLDTSKNQKRRWCDMKLCGNRMKSRRFRAKASR